MSSLLDQWQERLLSHFGALAAQRAQGAFPLFALEHCLSEADLKSIAVLLRDQLASGASLGTHWLPWVIYATESGYGYSGLEYWQSFEERMPYWQFDHRYSIAECFKTFQKTFSGYVPTGQWASHFKLIAWPITHAILPQDLQFQFARALYDIRFRLASSDQLTIGNVGRLLSANSYHATTRFEQFLQQEDLTGRIILALLGDSSNEGSGPIHPNTLRRIVADLERVRSAREWLSETQRTVTDRFKGIGHGSGFFAHDGTLDSDDLLVEEVKKIRIRPSIELRYTGQGTWSAVMEIPDFRQLASTSVGLRAFLSKTRCRISGSPDPKPAGWVLSGNRRSTLRDWPRSDVPLISFEQPNPKLQQLLECECRLDRGPRWLFKVGADGTAREILSKTVRPGHSYLIASVPEITETSGMLTGAAIDCYGIHIYKVDVPAACVQSDIAWLKAVNLQAARTITVWPAGILARLWDGEGNSEWLTTDAPCFGLLNDTPVDSYGVSLARDSEVTIKPQSPGAPVFIGLPCLPPGKHELTVKAYRNSEGPHLIPTEVAAGFLILNVRDPEPWSPGRPQHSGLVVRLDPNEATLDALWEGQVALTVLGPESYTADISIALKDARGNSILTDDVAHSAPLPVSATEWRRMLERVTHREANAWSYLDAVSGELTVDGGELGRHKTEFERDIRPLHWVARSHHGNVTLRLLDDSGMESARTRVGFFSMERPREYVPLQIDELRSGVGVTAPGGLFIADQEDLRDIMVVSTGTTSAGLQGLGVTPDMGTPAVSAGSTAVDLALYEDWVTARLAGYLGAIRRDTVVRAFCREFVRVACGPMWVRVEDNFRENPHSLDTRSRLENCVHKQIGFAAVLSRDCSNASLDRVAARQWYSDVAADFGICTDRFLSGFAFEFMTRPALVHSTYGMGVDRYLRDLRRNEAVFRGARLAALYCTRAGASGCQPMDADRQ